ncbi:flavin monoamine oxidase family protein [Bacillus toyonensis]|uniref:flavin monoamine oxidase family protein n=1 Tax=Bacillus toyonensis TaxID=155322 RepID=UPI00211F4261|nr:NAD(P)/FAD-dependent oxidoreductase [Bacillus toyonensis]
MGRMTFMRILKQAYLEIYKTMGDDIEQSAVPLQGKKYVKKNEKLVASMMSNLRTPFLHLDSPSSSSSTRIIIVGAGLAGLTCAYRLKQAGYKTTIYEASERVGGRVHTRRGDFADNQFVEAGGEFISPGELRIQQLATELGLQLDNLTAAELPGTEIIYYFNGAPYTFAELVADFQQIFNQIQTDAFLAGFPTLYNHYTQRGYELDHMSVTDYINAYVPGGMNSRLGKFLDVANKAFLSSESSDTSALLLVYPYAFGAIEHGEQLRVQGGNDQIPKKLKKRLSGQIKTETRLIAFKENENGIYTLTFQKEEDIFDVEADHVVMAIPFTILRSSVDYSKAGLQPLKVTAIQELGMGTAAKLHVQFTERYWNTLGYNGESFSDLGYVSSIEASRSQPGVSGILENFTGGNIGAGMNIGTPQERAQQFLRQLEHVLPGISTKWNGKVTRDYRLGNPFSLGSYSYYKVGQMTKFAGIQSQPEGTNGNLHFAGEHTAGPTMNGAVRSGERAAQEILSSLIENELVKNVE